MAYRATETDKTAEIFPGRLMEFGFIAILYEGWPTERIKSSKLAGPVHCLTEMLNIWKHSSNVRLKLFFSAWQTIPIFFSSA